MSKWIAASSVNIEVGNHMEKFIKFWNNQQQEEKCLYREIKWVYN